MLQGGPHPQLTRASGRNKILLKRWMVDGGWWMVDGGWWSGWSASEGRLMLGWMIYWGSCHLHSPLFAQCTCAVFLHAVQIEFIWRIEKHSGEKPPLPPLCLHSVPVHFVHCSVSWCALLCSEVRLHNAHVSWISMCVHVQNSECGQYKRKK